MKPEIQEEIKSILDELERNLKLAIRNWWNDTKQNRPETLPWFHNGVKGFLRKIWYNNQQENPDWKNYKQESVQLSLNDYLETKKDLENCLIEAAPTDVKVDTISPLVNMLMPMVKSAIQRINNLYIFASKEPEVAKEPEHKMGPMGPMDSPKPAPAPEEPKTVPETVPEPTKDAEVVKPEEKTKDFETSPVSVEKPEDKKPDEPVSTPSAPSTTEPAVSEPEKTSETPVNSLHSALKGLKTDLTPDNKVEREEAVMKSFRSVGVNIKKARNSKSGLQIVEKNTDITPESINHYAETIVNLVDAFYKELSADELKELGLNKLDHDDIGTISFWGNGKKWSWAGIAISPKIGEAIKNYLKTKEESLSQIDFYKKLLRENNETAKNLWLSRKFSGKDKKEFFLKALSN